MKPQEQRENLMRELNFYEITVDRTALDEYEEFNENEGQLEFLEGMMKFLGLKTENESNMEELKKFLKEKWKLFKDKKKSHRRQEGSSFY